MTPKLLPLSRVKSLPQAKQAEQYAQRALADKNCQRGKRWLKRAEDALWKAHRGGATARDTDDAHWLINSAIVLLDVRGCNRR